MNHKRKRSRRQVRCTICTKHTWRGNGKERHNHQWAKQREKELK